MTDETATRWGRDGRGHGRFHDDAVGGADRRSGEGVRVTSWCWASAARWEPTLARRLSARRLRSGSWGGAIQRARRARGAGRSRRGPITADLLDRAALERLLPRAENVMFMAGRKFGASPAILPLTWAMNVQVPAMVAGETKASRIVAFSTGNVYPFVPVEAVARATRIYRRRRRRATMPTRASAATDVRVFLRQHGARPACFG